MILFHPLNGQFEQRGTNNLIKNNNGYYNRGKRRPPLGKFYSHFLGKPKPDTGLGDKGHPVGLIALGTGPGQTPP